MGWLSIFASQGESRPERLLPATRTRRVASAGRVKWFCLRLSGSKAARASGGHGRSNSRNPPSPVPWGLAPYPIGAALSCSTPKGNPRINRVTLHSFSLCSLSVALCIRRRHPQAVAHNPLSARCCPGSSRSNLTACPLVMFR